MNTIELKPNNAPTKPGIYFIRCPEDAEPDYMPVIEERGELYTTCMDMPTNKLSECRPGILWSDEVTFLPAK